MKHTPGPWHALPKFKPSHCDHGYRLVATVRKDLNIYAEASNMVQEGKGWVWGDAEADAALLAAAPDMFAALTILVEQYQSVPDFTMGGNLTNEGFLRGAEALRKATGEL
jgi:hypothetical protein